MPICKTNNKALTSVIADDHSGYVTCEDDYFQIEPSFSYGCEKPNEVDDEISLWRMGVSLEGALRFEVGLPEAAAPAPITEVGDEAARKRFAVEAGLPETATWAQINEVSDEAARKRFAVEAGLPEDATWEEINAARDAANQGKK